MHLGGTTFSEKVFRGELKSAFYAIFEIYFCQTCGVAFIFSHITFILTQAIDKVDPALNSKVCIERDFLEVSRRFSHLYDHFFVKILVQNHDFCNIF